MDSKISVIIPCYNQAHFLSDSVSSVIAQDYTNWECFIVNDGSNDQTEKIAQDLCDKDIRIKYIKKQNGGLSSARNAALEQAQGKWIQFLDADDIIEPRKFSTQLASLSDKETTLNFILYCNYRFGEQTNIHDEVDQYVSCYFKTSNYLEELIERWEESLIIPCNSFLFSRGLFFQEDVRFDENLLNHEDFDCWLTIFSKNPRVVFNDEILCRYRLSNNSMSGNMKLMGEGFLHVINKHLKTKKNSPIIHLILQRKRLNVKLRYNRFDLLNAREKLVSWRVLYDYYTRRFVQKLFHRNR